MPEEHKIADIRLTPVWIPFEHPVVTASGTLHGSALALIDIDTYHGVRGCAYIFAYTRRTLRALCQLNEDIKDLLIDGPVQPATARASLTETFTLLGRQGLLGMLAAGIDMALWDALGKDADQPVCELLAAKPSAIPAYMSFGAIDPEKDQDRLESAASSFKAIKVKLGGQSVDHDVSNLRAIRQIVGNEIALMVDYNQAFGVDEALARAEAIAQFDVCWIEEPVPADDLPGHAAVRACSPIKVQTGENCWFASGARNVFALQACDYFMPDVMKIGGFSGWMETAATAEELGVPLSSHAFVEASAHALAATPTAHWLEYLDKARPICQEGYDVIDGCVTARGPGLGITWDVDAVRHYTFN